MIKITTENPLQEMIYVMENVTVVEYNNREITRGFFKIGWVQFESTLPRRLTELQIGNPHPLTLYCAAPGKQFEEQDIHTLMYVFTQRGEWYPAEDNAVKRVVDSLKEYGVAAALERAQRELHAYKGTKQNTKRDCWLRFVSRYESRKTGESVKSIRRRVKPRGYGSPF